MGTRRSRLAAAGVGLLIALLLAEGLVRLAGVAPPAPAQVDPELQFHALDADPAIGYTLRPGARGTFQNAAVRVNERGCRDDAVRAAPPVRIVALGDSITFGASIDQDATWEARLDRALGPDVDVVNCGVSGYNLLQAQARYDAALADLGPDIIVLNVFSDDLSAPYRLAASGPWTWLRARSEAARVAELGWIGLVGGGGRRLPDWAADDVDYRIEATRQGIAWVQARVAEGRKVLVVAHPMLMPVTHRWQATRSEVRSFAESTGQPALFLEPIYADATAGQLPRLSINPEAGDPHPNADGQEIIALALWRRLHELGWIDVPPRDTAGPRPSP